MNLAPEHGESDECNAQTSKGQTNANKANDTEDLFVGFVFCCLFSRVNIKENGKIGHVITLTDHSLVTLCYPVATDRRPSTIAI